MTVPVVPQHFVDHPQPAEGRKSNVALVAWRPLPSPKGSLIGHADYEVFDTLVVHNCTVHVTAGKPWCGLPGIPQLDRERALIDERGKTRYTPALSFVSKELRDRFSKCAIRAPIERYPHALDAAPGGGT